MWCRRAQGNDKAHFHSQTHGRTGYYCWGLFPKTQVPFGVLLTPSLLEPSGHRHLILFSHLSLSYFPLSLLFPCTEFCLIPAAVVHHKNGLWHFFLALVSHECVTSLSVSLCISECTWRFVPSQAFTGKIWLVSSLFQGSSVLPLTTCCLLTYWGLFCKRNSWGRDGEGKLLNNGRLRLLCKLRSEWATTTNDSAFCCSLKKSFLTIVSRM